MTNTRLVQAGSLWTLHVKDIDAGNLADALDLAPEHVVVEAFRPNPSRLWSMIELQLLQTLPVQSMSVRDLRLDLRLTKREFIDLAPMWRVGGVNAWFMSRPCPDTLRVLDLPVDRRHHILEPMGLSLEFTWPLAAIGDWACFVTTRREIADRLIAVLGQ